ncbi:MAG: hypothetical protein KGR70_16270 [Cyanobacteria bacterium REEB494]|nr:hypothetical protein [Cyanobacteria bacterium REEB494]
MTDDSKALPTGGAIAKHSLWAIAFSVSPGSFSREKSERIEGRLRSTPYG